MREVCRAGTLHLGAYGEVNAITFRPVPGWDRRHPDDPVPDAPA